jgi:putative hydrolase
MNKDKLFFKAGVLRKDIPLIDLHVHTRYSDGQSTVKEYLEFAKDHGYKAICFTDHVDFTTTWYDSFADMITNERTKYDGMDVCYGLEVRAKDRDGSLNAPEKIIDRAEMVIGVIHSIPSADGHGKHKPEEFSREELLELEYSISLSLLENNAVSVLGHPMGNYEKLYGAIPQAYYRDLIQKAKKEGKAIEINSKYTNDFKGFLDLCMTLDPLVSLGSDAHSIHELGMVNSKLHEALG